MRFMMIMFPGSRAETDRIPEPKEFEAMMKYNEELAKAGVLLGLDGLRPTKYGARVRLRGAKDKKAGRERSVVDGPFTEAKEIVGGYWMIQVRSREEAVEWAKRIPLENEAEDAFVELRQVYEVSDFGPEVEKLAQPVAERLPKK